jgi:hypothetical protein
MPDAQSEPVPQEAPAAQLGEQAGVTHRPAEQTLELQSAFAPHVLPAGQLGLQEGATQVPAMHVREAQSLLLEQA